MEQRLLLLREQVVVILPLRVRLLQKALVVLVLILLKHMEAVTVGAGLLL
jgi:hypothetical protein